MTDPQLITVYVSPGDPVCAALLKYLTDRDVGHTVRDVNDPEVRAALLGSIGRVTAPVTQIGEKMVIGFDPLQLAGYLPKDTTGEPAVSFGAAVRTVTAELAGASGLPATYGVEVGPVKDGSPAAAAGVQPGDIITEIGGYTLTGGREQFIQAVSVRRPGDTMALGVWRDRATHAVPVEFPVS